MNVAAGGADDCRCRPCRCLACGQIVGVYEDAVAVAPGGNARRGSPLTLGALDPERTQLYHASCWGVGALGRSPARP